MEAFEGDFSEQMHEALRTAEVISLFFVRVGKSMIIDFRRDIGVQPAVMLDDIVASPRARLQSFRRLRSGLPLPERLTLAPWGSAIREFRDQGLLEELSARCYDEGGPEMRTAVRTAYHKLEKMEQRYLRDLVRGVGMHTIWQRSDP